MTQKQQILIHLKKGLPITPIDALHEFGCFRLAAHIYELRSEGYWIKTTIISDGKKHWAEYKLVL